MSNKIQIFTKFISILLFSLIFISCKKEEKKVNQQKIFEQSQNFYAVQGKDTALTKNILIVVIDPHAEGKKAALLFEDIANQYNCTVIGLTDVQNGSQDFIDRINKNINGAVAKFNLQVKQLYLAGFSGGARMAFSYCATYPQIVSGLLMCGAGMPQNSNLALPTSLIIGTKDANFSEQYKSPFSQELFNDNRLNIVFDGQHQWPDKKFLNLGMSFLLIKNNQQNFTTPDKFLNAVINELKKSSDKYIYFKALEAAYKLSSGEQKNKYKSSINSLVANNEFKNYITKLESSLNEEVARNQMLYNSLQTKDINWWKKEIKSIEKKMDSKNVLEANSYYRTKAFLGLAMYSLTSREIQNPQSTMIDKYLKIYELLEPDNPDMLKFKKMLQKR